MTSPERKEPPERQGPASALLTVQGGETAPSLNDVARYLGVPTAALNKDFGVVLFDPQRRLFAVEVDARALDGIVLPKGSGPFSNPEIAPFGARGKTK